MATLPSEFLDELVHSEGRSAVMYLDTVGKVTVGIGNMLPNAKAARALPFVKKDTGAKATDAEIDAEFKRVSAMPAGKLLKVYEAAATLVLDDKDIKSLFEKRIGEFTSQLALYFPNIDTYPPEVRAALLDMAFNLGTSGLVKKFPSFRKAVLREDWLAAAMESHRPQVQPSRNAAVRRWLTTAAMMKAKPLKLLRKDFEVLRRTPLA